MTVFQSFSKEVEAVTIFNLSSTPPPTCSLPHPTAGSCTPDMRADKEVPSLLLPDGESQL